MNSKAVLIFGSFNPITNAHLFMGIQAKIKFLDADIIYIPAPSQYISDWKKYDDKDILSNSARLCLIVNSIIPYKSLDFHVDPVELVTFDAKDKVLTTFETIEILKNKYSYDEYIVCLGADKVEELELWKNGTELVKNNKFLIIERDHSKGLLPINLKQYADHFIYADEDFSGVSSTQIRTAMKENKLDEVKNLIPSFVYNYLKGVEDEF